MDSVSSKLEMLFFRLLTIGNDRKLEVFLQKTLVDVINAVASGGTDSLEKGMEFLNHVNRRVKTNMDVKLPLSELLDHFLSESRSILTMNLALVYVKMSIMRVTEDECVTLLPKFCESVATNLTDAKVSQQLLLFSSRCLICSAQLPSNKWLWACYLDNKPFRLMLLQFFHDVLAFSNSSRENLQLQLSNVETHESAAPPSLSRHSYLLIAKELLLELQLSIIALKVAVIKIISSDLFTDQERLPLLLLASINGPDEVEFTASSAMRKISIDDLLNDREVCKKLFTLYLGSAGANSNDENRVTEASVTLKLSLLPLFNRSHVASIIFPSNIKTAFDGLFGKAYDIPKLKQLAASFLLSIIKNCSGNSLNSVGPIIFTSLKNLINTCKHEGVILLAYQCLGLLGAKVPNLVLNNMRIVQEKFEALSEAPPVLASSIADCLTSWLPSFYDLKDVANAGILQAIVSTYCHHDSVKCRLVALKFTESLVKTQYLDFRWTLCCAYVDTHEEIKREAKRLLRLSLSAPEKLTKFEELVRFFDEKLKSTSFYMQECMGAAEARQRKEPFNSELIATVALYLLNYAKVLAKASDKVNNDNESWSDYRDEYVNNDPDCWPRIFKFLSAMYSECPEVVDTYTNIVATSVFYNFSVELLDLLTVLLYCTHGRFDEQKRDKLVKKTVLDMTSLAKKNACLAWARVYTLCLTLQERNSVLQSYSKKLTGDMNEFQLLRPGEILIVPLLLSEGLLHVSAEMFEHVESGYVKYIEESYTHGSGLLEILCCSLEQIYRRMNIIMDQADQEKCFKDCTKKINNIFEVLSKISLTRKESVGLNVKEAVTRSLGFLSTSFLDDSIYELLIQRLLAIGEGPPFPELQFTVGSSMIDAVLGEWSPSRRNIFTETEKEYMACIPSEKLLNCEKRAMKLLDYINGKFLDANRHLRQAAFIWLYVLVERSYKYKLKFLNERLCDIQQAFINGLAENDDFTQDVACQGISIVFNVGTIQRKKDMLGELVGFLTSGPRKLKVSITGDTELFANGELGTGPSGESLTTYKELCALATDLNQPDLIYKFLQLANQSAMLNAKKGAAYGFNILMQEAKHELEPYLPQIVPKLYRYRFDPDTQVMNVMRNLWQIITLSQQNVVKNYLSAIYMELLSSLNSPLWRVRESSCLAMSDLLSAYVNDVIIENAGRLYELLFRLNDDIKYLFLLYFLESVRLSAKSALKSLYNFTLRNCESGKGEAATRFIGIVLPTLIDKGLRSTLRENRIFSLKIIMHVSSKAGPVLRPHLTVIVPCLLQSLSEVEPSWLNYLAARSNIDELEALDTARASAARSSPMVTVLHGLILYIDESVIVHLCPLLVDLLKNSVGVSTRIGTAQFLTDLCVRRRHMFSEIKETCDKLTNALLIGLGDRNLAIRKQFSTTLSYIIKFSSKKQINRVLTFILKKIQGQESSDEITSYHLLRAFADNSNEILADSFSLVVPYVFLISSREVEENDENGKKQKQLWEELWNDIVPGTEAAIRLYKNELLEVVSKVLLENPAWVCKAEAATMLTRILLSKAVEISSAEADELFTKLSSLLRGKVWSGKEKVLYAIVALLQVSGEVLKAYWKTHEERCEKFSFLWKECLKKKRAYCVEAIFCASWFCKTFEISNETKDLLHLIEFKGFGQAESSSDSESENRNLKAVVRVKVMNRLFSALPHCVIALRNGKHGEVAAAIDLCLRVLDTNDLFWKEKTGLIFELGSLIARFPKHVDVTQILYSLMSLVNLHWNTQNSFSRQCLQVVDSILSNAVNGNILLDTEGVIKCLLEFKKTTPSKSSWTTEEIIDKFLTENKRK